jgi:hypothetical protein
MRLSDMNYTTLHLDDIDPLRSGGAGLWHPIRRALGATALALNAYSASDVGDELIERHDERSSGSAGHEEIYLDCGVEPPSSSTQTTSTRPPARCCWCLRGCNAQPPRPKPTRLCL